MQDEVSITRDWPGTIPITIYDGRRQLVARFVDHICISQVIGYRIRKLNISKRIQLMKARASSDAQRSAVIAFLLIRK